MQSYSCARTGVAASDDAAAQNRQKAKAFIEFGVMDGGNYELSARGARRASSPRLFSRMVRRGTLRKMPTISRSPEALEAELI